MANEKLLEQDLKEKMAFKPVSDSRYPEIGGLKSTGHLEDVYVTKEKEMPQDGWREPVMEGLR